MLIHHLNRFYRMFNLLNHIFRYLLCIVYDLMRVAARSSECIIVIDRHQVDRIYVKIAL